MTQNDINSEETRKTEPKPRKRMPTRKERERRTLLMSFLAGGTTVGLSMLGYVPIMNASEMRLRPPGALDERNFLASCIKCGQCVQVCPVEAIFLADITDGFGIGVPYIDARKQACDFSCDTPQCVLACPTGSLSHHLNKKEQTRMGFARLDKPDMCLARQGAGFQGVARGETFKGIHRFIADSKEEKKILAKSLGMRVADLRWTPIKLADHPYDREICDLCVIECPIKNAITLEPMSNDPNDKRRTPVVHKFCVGCGMCEMICPVEPAAIVIDERKTYQMARKEGHAS